MLHPWDNTTLIPPKENVFSLQSPPPHPYKELRAGAPRLGRNTSPCLFSICSSSFLCTCFFCLLMYSFLRNASLSPQNSWEKQSTLTLRGSAKTAGHCLKRGRVVVSGTVNFSWGGVITERDPGLLVSTISLPALNSYSNELWTCLLICFLISWKILCFKYF